MTRPEYKPRPNDDLVEPLYAGLRDQDQASVPEARPRPRGLWIAWLVAALALASLVGALYGYLS